MEINKIHCGKMEDVLKDFPDNFFDSIVTDPPYGISFMNKHWDYQVPTVEQWKEAFRTLKAGGFILCACGTRTQHRMVVNIEDAGFEIRDVITWHYGSGFPKSLDISKAIDKMGERYEFFDEVRLFLKTALDKSGLSFKEINTHFEFATNGSGMAGHWFANITQQTLPTKTQWFKLKELLNFSNEFDETFNSCVNPNERPIIGLHKKPAKEIYQSGELSKEVYLTSASSEAAKEWEGWGTALKPATEFWTLARKPLSEKTVAENVLKHGTGGINIDGCRIGESGATKRSEQAEYPKNDNGTEDRSGSWARTGHNVEEINKGRFPANVIFDEFMGAELDKQTGVLTSGTGAIRKDSKGLFGLGGDGEANVEYGDSGGASRFFYCPKPDNFERDKGLKGLKGLKVNDGRETEIDNPYQRGETVRQNHHPTVKPIDLMRYLVKLVTPKGGIVLDPFCGSGTTLIGAKMELMNYIGIDIDSTHIPLAEARVASWNPDLYKPQTLF